MPAQTLSFPLPAPTVRESIPLIGFLRTELAPFPGRAIATFRVVVAAVVVLVLCMTLRIPEPHLAVWVVTRVAMEESSQSLLTGLVFLVALTVGLAIPLVLLTFAMDQAWLRFCLMAALAAAGLFLRRTFVIGAFGFVMFTERFKQFTAAGLSIAAGTFLYIGATSLLPEFRSGSTVERVERIAGFATGVGIAGLVSVIASG